MTIEKINFSYPLDNLQSVFDTQEMTALELASKTSKKVDECVELVNGVEQTAINATAIVDEMKIAQEQFVTENADVRQQLIAENQTYIDSLNTSKTTFETDMTTALNAFEDSTTASKTAYETALNTSKTTFETDMTTALNTFEESTTASKTAYETALNISKTTFETNMTNSINDIVSGANPTIISAVNTKVDSLVNDGTIENLVVDNPVITGINTSIANIDAKLDNYIDVKAMGAKGDSVTDDYAILQNILDNANGRPVFFPKGVYLISQSLKLPATGVIYGAGQYETYIRPSANVNIFEINKIATDRLYISQMHLQDNAHVQTTTGGIFINSQTAYIKSLYINDIIIAECWKGIYNNLSSENGLIGMNLKDVLLGVRESAIYLTNTTACHFINVVSDHVNVPNDPLCTDIYIDGNTIAGGGMWIEEMVSQAPNGNGIVIKNFLQLWGNHLSSDNCGKNGMEFYNCSQIKLINCYCSLAGRLTTGYGTKIWSSAKQTYGIISMINCQIGATYNSPALIIEEMSNVNISTCQIIQNQNNAVVIKNSENVTINACNILQNNGVGVTIDNSNYCIVNNNVIRLNTKGIVETNNTNFSIINGNFLGYNGSGQSDSLVVIGANTVNSGNIL